MPPAPARRSLASPALSGPQPTLLGPLAPPRPPSAPARPPFWGATRAPKATKIFYLTGLPAPKYIAPAKGIPPGQGETAGRVKGTRAGLGTSLVCVA